MRIGYKIALSAITIMILVTLTIGTSYSFYSISDTQTDPNELVTTCFNVEVSGSNAISLRGDGSYAYPMSEATALSKITPYTVTITNTCSASELAGNIKYDLSLNTLLSPASTLTDSVRYKLDRTAPTAVSGTSAMLKDVTAINKLPEAIRTEKGIATSYNLISGELGAGEAHTYNLYLWIDENATNAVQAQTFDSKVYVYSYM